MTVPTLNAKRNINLAKCCNFTWNINERNCNKKRCILTDIVWLIAYVAVVLPWWFYDEIQRKILLPHKTKRLKLRWHCKNLSVCLANRLPLECVLCWSNFAAYQHKFSKSNLTFTADNFALNLNKHSAIANKQIQEEAENLKIWEVWVKACWKYERLQKIWVLAKSSLCVCPLFSWRHSAVSKLFCIFYNLSYLSFQKTSGELFSSLAQKL